MDMVAVVTVFHYRAYSGRCFPLNSGLPPDQFTFGWVGVYFAVLESALVSVGGLGGCSGKHCVILLAWTLVLCILGSGSKRPAGLVFCAQKMEVLYGGPSASELPM